MNKDDDLRMTEMLNELKKRGKIPEGMEFIARDLSSKPIPEVILLLTLMKKKDKVAGDLLCDSAINAILLAYCDTVDEAVFLLKEVMDSLQRYDKALNIGLKNEKEN